MSYADVRTYVRTMEIIVLDYVAAVTIASYNYCNQYHAILILWKQATAHARSLSYRTREGGREGGREAPR